MYLYLKLFTIEKVIFVLLVTLDTPEVSRVFSEEDSARFPVVCKVSSLG